MRRRLHWQIFGAISLAGVFALLLATALGMLFRDRAHPLPRFARDVGAFILADLPEHDPPAFERELRRRARRLRASISVWDRKGKLIARAGRRLAPPRPRGVRTRLFEHDPHRVFIPLEDGRLLGVAFDHDRGPRFGARELITALAALVLVLLLGSHWAARRIARRLEALERSVTRFGEGELSARSELTGSDEIARLSEAFNRSSHRIAGLLQRQRRMLQSASHELRSPLSRLRMAVELTMESGIDAATRERVCTGAARDIDELDDLISDLLLAERLSDSELPREFAALDLSAIVHEEAARVGARVDAPPCQVSGNARMLRSLVRNLLENARRYGRDPVVVTLGADDEHIVLRVDDAGEGVPVEDRERIFEPFFRRAGHRESKDGGVGLGLALVRSIAEHHGGSVRYVDQGLGSCFEVKLKNT